VRYPISLSSSNVASAVGLALWIAIVALLPAPLVARLTLVAPRA